MSFIFNPMKMGLTGVYMPKFDVDRWFDVVENDKPMMIFLVPAMAELITASPRFDAADLSGPMAVSIGSAPLAPATLKKLQDRMPQASVINSYGLTEAGPAFITMPKDEADKRIGSVGQAEPADGSARGRSRHRRGPARAGSRRAARATPRASGASTTRTTARTAPRGRPTDGCAPAISRISTPTASSTSPVASRT